MSDSQATKASDARGKGAVSRLLAFAGPRRTLTYLGCALSAVSMLVSFGPYVCIWLVARDLIAVAPDWGAATGIAAYGWWAFGLAAASILIYFAGLMCTHLAAFRCASNREHPHLLRRPHVHAPRGLPLRVQHAQAHHGPPHAREPRLL